MVINVSAYLHSDLICSKIRRAGTQGGPQQSTGLKLAISSFPVTRCFSQHVPDFWSIPWTISLTYVKFNDISRLSKQVATMDRWYHLSFTGNCSTRYQTPDENYNKDDDNNNNNKYNYYLIKYHYKYL